MRIATWNVNGMRAALKKGFEQQIATVGADVWLLQEVRALPEQLPADWRDPDGWHVHWHPAEKKGYAGTAVWSREPLEILGTGMGDGDDPEGRMLHVRTGGVEVVSTYLPSGSSGPEKQAKKEAFMARFRPWAAEMQARGVPTIVGGDLNIAHTERDIWNAKGNAKNSGFLPHERDWFGELLSDGWTDAQRAAVGDDVQGPYSWWSNRGQARAKDRGWRIDYLLLDGTAAKAMTGAGTHREGGLTVSDHAPVWVDLG